MRHDPDLVIGLVNNMPVPAQKSTEHAFNALLGEAAKGVRLRLRYFVLPGIVPPGPHYESLAGLLATPRHALPIDGLIVTGAEPLAARIDEEPYWPELARLVDWAADNTVSTLWSCLAAQVAVLRLDGIVRRPLGEKISGVFECVKVSDHPFMSDAPGRWPVPHSRLNDIDEYVLAESGYQILSRAPRIGADSFLKEVGNSLFVLLQGHPEYGADSLMREYRRDIKRFLRGHQPHYPQMPEHYFAPGVREELLQLRDRAGQLVMQDVIAAFDAIVPANPQASWHNAAKRLYTKWIAYLAERHIASRPDAVVGMAAT